jgi:hypothetical protein
MNTDRRSVAGVALALGAMTLLAGDLAAQKASPAELAAKLSGTWTMNRELSPGFSTPGGPGGRRGGGRASFLTGGLRPAGPPDTLSRALLPAFALRATAGRLPARSVSASAEATADAPKRLRREGRRVTYSLRSFALSFVAAGGQRRGSVPGGDGPNGPSDLTPEEIAAQVAIRQLQQVAPQITIKATPESVTFTDQRGEQTFTINDKNATIDVGGAKITAKNKWDKATLRQEFSNPKSKLIRTWEIDENNRLVLKAKLESMTLMSTEAKAVFDRQ